MRDLTIIGAGLGGLVLACALHRQAIDVAIYEATMTDLSERLAYILVGN